MLQSSFAKFVQLGRARGSSDIVFAAIPWIYVHWARRREVHNLASVVQGTMGIMKQHDDAHGVSAGFLVDTVFSWSQSFVGNLRAISQ